MCRVYWEDVITLKGQEMLYELLESDKPLYLGLGSDWGRLLRLSETNTDLGAPIPDERVLAEVSFETEEKENDTICVKGLFPITEERMVSEAGLFDAPTGGNLLARGIFDTFVLKPRDKFEVTFSFERYPEYAET